MSTPPPPAPPNDSEPMPPSGPADLELWGESDVGLPTSKDIEPVTTGKAVRPAPTIGYVGRYALKHLLGEGGLGAVYAAHDPLLSRLIAVKTLNVDIDDDERDAFNAIFLNEARAAGGLSHPHIVTVFDAGVSDKRAYIAMELLKGRDLRQLRGEGWRPTPTQAALLVRRVADALAYAHSKGVIHRDIKPANIFMVGRGQPRVLDFGIAHITHQRDGMKPSTLAAGSPYYMAPEQVRSEAGDRRTDVFSLGVVLYELLTDTKPFVGDSIEAITSAVQTHQPPLAHQIDPSVPPALADIAARAMAKEPDDRFRSARAFSRELRQWLELNPGAGESDAPIARAAEPPPRPPRKSRLLVLSGVAALAIAAGLVYGFVGMLEAPALNRPVALAPAAAPPLPPADVPVATVPVAPAPVAAATATAASEPASAVLADSAPISAAPDRPAAASEAMPSSVVAMVTLNADGRTTTSASAATAAAPRAALAAPPALAGAAASNDGKDGMATSKSAPKAVAKETPKERKARELRERDLRPASTVAPMVTGTVALAVSPWGTVEVDGNAAGIAPPLHELTLPEGRHQIVIRNTDFPPYSSTVTVSAGQPVVIKHKFGS